MFEPLIEIETSPSQNHNIIKESPYSPSNEEDQRFQTTSDGSPLQVNIKIEQNFVPEQTCRICLKEGRIPIYGLKDLSEELQTFGGIEITPFDPYPKCLCSSCNGLLESAILLRKTAQESNKTLRNLQLGLCERNTETCTDDHEDNLSNNNQSCDSDIVTVKFRGIKHVKVKKERVFKSLVKDDIKKDVENTNTSRNNKEGDIKGKFKCEPCNLTFDSFIEYSDHRINVKHSLIRETCPVCNITTKYLRAHLARHRDEFPFTCDICEKRFKASCDLSNHKKSHSLDNLRFKCTLCPYRGRYSYSLTLHMRQHTGEKPYKCSECPSVAFTNTSNLRKHILKWHKTDYEFKCTECGKGFHSKVELDCHIEVEHWGIKNHLCNLCGRAFGYRKQMLKHLLRTHKTEPLGNKPLYVLLNEKAEVGTGTVTGENEDADMPSDT